MTAIYKKEFRGFLNSMIGYVFIAFLLVVSGIYFTAYHLQAMYPKFSYTLQGVLFVFLIAVPVLTMRTLAEERKQKTDQLLLTAPVSVESIVMGKYLALVSVLGITILILALYPLILSQFGTISYAESYLSLFGFFLMGCTYLAVGLFISSLTESQVIAAVLTFLALFVSYVMEGIADFFPDTAIASFASLVAVVLLVAAFLYHMTKQKILTAVVAIGGVGVLTVLYFINGSAFEGVIQKVLGIVNITDHFTEFANGIFDVTGLVYYLSFIIVCLFLTVQSIQKRRWS